MHRPASSRSAFIAALLNHLQCVGFAGVPRYLGQDPGGRDRFSFLPGQVPSELGYFADAQLIRAAALIRDFHDATVGFEGRGTAEVVCHGDLSPCNCVFRSGLPSGLIDFDAAEPGDRSCDVGYAAWLWLDLGAEEIGAGEQHRRLNMFMAAYGSGVKHPVAAVLAAQRRLSTDRDASAATREWARACEAWTLTHLAGSPTSD